MIDVGSRVRCLRYGSKRFPKRPLGIVVRLNAPFFVVKLDHPTEIPRDFRTLSGEISLYLEELEEVNCDGEILLEDLL